MFFNPSRKWGYALATGFFAALTLWTGLQLAVMLALWSMGYGVWILVCLPYSASRWLGMGKRLTVLALVAVILSTPLLIPVARGWQGDWLEDFDEGTGHQTDLLA